MKHTNTVKAIKIQHYSGKNSRWNIDKEIILPENEITTTVIENITAYWHGEQRIVLKSEWEKRNNTVTSNAFEIPTSILKQLKPLN